MGTREVVGEVEGMLEPQRASLNLLRDKLWAKDQFLGYQPEEVEDREVVQGSEDNLRRRRRTKRVRVEVVRILRVVGMERGERGIRKLWLNMLD